MNFLYLQFEVVQRQQLRNELLMCSSQIKESTTLLDVFFLDGSRKTVCYDETTTAADVCKVIICIILTTFL